MIEPIPVLSMSQILEEDGERTITDFEARGQINIPDHATWDGEAYVWKEEQHILSFNCPSCSSEEPCLQLVKIFVYTGHILVCHEYEGAEELPS